jgi:hypothetical protein
MVFRIPLDSVGGLEAVQRRTNSGATLLATGLASTAAFVGGIFLYAALFGSCPTVYSDSAGTAVLDAEIFANRISAIFEARDLDLLRAHPDANGIVRLEVRNEALETHYINALELLEIEHAADETIVPDERGKPVAVRSPQAPVHARDAVGRDVTSVLARRDGDVFSTDPSFVAAQNANDIWDSVDLTFANPRRESALTLHLRNSVLNSVLLYDVIMGAQGMRAVDWLGLRMERIGPAVEFARWHHSRFGLRVSIKDGAEWRDVARHPTYGPIAWRDVLTLLPRVDGDSLQVRLRFIKDDWRIDQIGLSAHTRSASARRILPAAVVDRNEKADAKALESMRYPDERYLQTTPGQRFWIEYRTQPVAPDKRRTYMLASHGFYTEWVRGTWVKAARPVADFRPTDDAIVQSLAKWKVARDSIAARFFALRVPVQ